MISIDTQILTLDGWKYYQELNKRDMVINYDQHSHTFGHARLGQHDAMDYHAVAYSIQSDATDQIVTLSHCCATGNNAISFQQALLMQQQEYIPIVIDNMSLLDSLQQWKVRLPATPFYASTYADIKPIPYCNVVWSAKSLTGMFLARRNEMIFITCD